MLETITSAYFTALVEQTIWAETSDGELALTVDSVRELAHAALPNASRIPFTAVFRGPESPTLTDGICSLRADGPEGWRLEGVFVNRVMPPPGRVPGAYYQLVISC
jgi:hypothetical protein